MNNRKKTLKNFFFSIIGQVATIALGVALPRLYIVSYGSEVNGMLASIQQFLVYLGLFEAGIGAATLQALYKPVAQGNHEDINGVIKATSVFYKKTAVCYGMGLLLIGFLYPLTLKTTLPYLFMVACVLLSGIGNFVLYLVHAKYKLLLQADGRFYVSVNLSTITTVLINIFKIILIMSGKGVLSVLAVSAVVEMIPAVFLMIYVRRCYPFLDLSVKPQFEKISQSKYMIVHQIAHIVFQHTDLLFISMICGLKAASVYAIYRMIISHIEAVLAIPMNSVGFILGQTYQTDKQKYTKMIDLFERWYAAALFSVYSVTLQLFVPFITIYTKGVTDAQYADGVLAVLFVLTAILVACRVPMVNTINYAGHFRQTLPQTIFETAINLVVTIPCTFVLGICGALIGTIAALLYRTNDIIIYANKRLLERSPKGTYAIYAEQVAISVLVFFLFCFFDTPTSYFGFFITGAGMLAVSSVCYFFFNLLISKESRKRFQMYLFSMCKRIKEKK